MKHLLRSSLALLIAVHCATLARAQTTFTLNPLPGFGTHGDGSIRPGDSIGTGASWWGSQNVAISAPGGYGIQPNDASGSTNGFNMRGLAYDPVTKNLVFVDTHSGSGGSANVLTNSAIYVLNGDTGQILGALNTNGITGGSYVMVAAGVADDGVVYVANQVNKNTGAYKIYRWDSTTDFINPPVVAYSNSAPNFERIGLTMAVRGAGTNTQILVGTADPAITGTANALAGTNVFLFTTGDGTNFVHHRLSAPGLTTAFCNDGIAFGAANTFWTKEVGQPLYFLAYDEANINYTNASTNTCAVIAKYTPSSPSDPLLNVCAIAVDNVNHLLGGMEEIGGNATGGNGKVWLFDIANATNRSPAILATRVYVVNFQKTTAPMGYVAFGNGRLYAHASNNGFLVNRVDATPVTAPSYTWTDYDLSGFAITRVSDLPASTRAAVGSTAHFEVFAVPDVTNYQWYSNSVPIAGANSYYLDVPNVQTAMSGTVYQVVAFNAVGSTNSVASTLTVVSAANFFHPVLLWSFVGGATNYISSGGGSSTPSERCIAYNALSNQLLVVRGPTAFANLRIFVVNPDTGAFLYTLKTNGLTTSPTLVLAGIGVADDGAVYACSVSLGNAFAVYRWADSGPNTLPVTIFGTNSSSPYWQGGPGAYNPIQDLVGDSTFRFGDNLAVHGAGNDTEIILDAQNATKYAGVLRPVPDGTMTNWTQTGYILQNILGSYGSGAYGTVIGRSLQFGPALASPPNGTMLPTFWQKRYNSAAGAPLAAMGYNPGGGLAVLDVANSGLPFFTNGPVGINFSLNLAAAINFVPAVGNNNASPDTLDYYDLSVPSQAVLLSRQNLPGANAGGHLANANAIGQVIFGYNPATATNYLFAIDSNNGIQGYYLSGGVTPPPKFLAQPANLRVLQGSSGSINAVVDQVATLTWYKGTNPPVGTGIQGNAYNINNALPTDAGDYFVIATNLNGSATSQVAHVTVALPGDFNTLSQVWAANPTNASTPFVTSTGGANTPNERAFAYNALSNQLIVVKCPPSSTAFTVWVVDATYGTNTYTMNTSTVVNQGASEVSGSNPIDLNAIGIADDGAVYICSTSPNASGGAAGDPTKMFVVYRWADSGPNTVPTIVFQGDPGSQPAGLNERWGDAMAARGSGINTELVLNSQDGLYGAVLKPTDSSMALFTNYWFSDSGGAGSIGRSIQFGSTNTVFEKRKGAALVYSRYITNTQSSALLYQSPSSGTLGGLFVDAAHKLAAGVDFVGGANTPDAVALYEVSDPSTPMLLARYSFPVKQVANANFICQTVVAGSRVYSLDANNGLMAFNIAAPANSLAPVTITSIVNNGNGTVTINYSGGGGSQFILMQSTSLALPRGSWTPVRTNNATPGNFLNVPQTDPVNSFYTIKSN